MIRRPSVGVLAIQGAFVEHESALRAVGADPCQVRTAQQMAELDGLVIPGGESTTLGLVAGDSGLLDALRTRISDGLPTFGTCAGLIMLAKRTTEGDQPLIGTMDVTVHRNAFGRQVASFETPIAMDLIGDPPMQGVFIRAPWIEHCGDDVEVLATYDSHVVAVRQHHMLAVAFHPELTDDTRLHAAFVDMIRNTAREQQTAGGSTRVRA